MRMPTTSLGKVKNILHGVQGGVILPAILVTIAVFTTRGTTDGRTGWYFGLCFLSMPILIYLTMVPAWSRARKFANIYAFAVLDCFGAVAWLSAWAAVTNYVVTGKGKGDVKDETGCNNFKFGSTAKCRLSEASIVFGVIVMLLFIATALISFKSIMEYKRTGALPGAMVGGHSMGGAAPVGGTMLTGTTKREQHGGRHDEEEAFDPNMNLRHEWEVDEYDHDEYNDRYGSGNPGNTGAGGHMGRGYVPAHVQDQGDDYENKNPLPRPAGSGTGRGDGTDGYSGYGSQSHLGPFSDDHELTSHQPRSTGPGPLGNDTSYHSPYGQGHGRL